MSISLARIDDRVIHGQITTRWTKARPVDSILVISDNVAKDDLRKRVLKAAANNLKLGIFPVDQAVEKVKMAMDSPKSFFLISDSPQYFSQMLDLGVDWGGDLDIGCMNTREGAKVLGRSVAIDQADYDAFENMVNKGINVYFQLLPDDEKKSWASLKKKYDSMD